MNIIERTKAIINECPNISSFSNGIHIDYTENVNGQYGIYSTNDQIIKEDIFGSQLRRHSFILYANNQSYTDYDRLNNSTFLLEMGYWLETQKGATVDMPSNKTGTITKMYTANAMVFDVIGDDINDGCTYQVQIYVEYKVDEPPINTPVPEPTHQLTVATYENGEFTLNGWCVLTYLDGSGHIVRTDEYNGGMNVSTVPEGATKVDVKIEPATEDCDFCGITAHPNNNKIRIIHQL